MYIAVLNCKQWHKVIELLLEGVQAHTPMFFLDQCSDAVLIAPQFMFHITCNFWLA